MKLPLFGPQRSAQEAWKAEYDIRNLGCRHAMSRTCASHTGTECRNRWYLVVVLHELQVALLTNEQVQVLLPVCMHSLHVCLPGRGGASHHTPKEELVAFWAREPEGREASDICLKAVPTQVASPCSGIGEREEANRGCHVQMLGLCSGQEVSRGWVG